MALLKQKLEEYITLLDQYVVLCREVLSRENEKRTALLENDYPRIEEVLQSQQASVMKLKSFEKKRVEMQRELGYGDKTAGEMVEAMEDVLPEEREAVRTRLRELRSLAQQISKLNQVSLEYAQTNLRLIGLLAQPGAQSETSGVYKPTAQRTGMEHIGNSLGKTI